MHVQKTLILTLLLFFTLPKGFAQLQVLERGSIHEAFAQRVTESVALEAVPDQPPSPITTDGAPHAGEP